VLDYNAVNYYVIRLWSSNSYNRPEYIELHNTANHQTRWSALSKGLAVMAGFLPAVGLPWAIGAAVGSLSAGSSVMADGDYSDYLLYGCPTIKSAITSTK